MSERVEEAVIRAALVRAVRVWEGRVWTGSPADLLFELAGHAVDPLSMPVSPQAFAIYLRRVAASLPAAGVEVIPWKCRGARRFTVRPLPVRPCRQCRGAWYRLTSYTDRIHARWVCGNCDPAETNPTLWLNVQLGSEPMEGYWKSLQRRVAPPAMSRAAPAGGQAAGVDPVMAAVRALLERCGETRLGPLSWIGPPGELLERIRECGSPEGLPGTPDGLSRKLRGARRELLGMAVEVDFSIAGKERLVSLRRIPAAPCAACRGAQFWFDGQAWKCGRCATPRVNPSTWFDLGGIKDLAETAADAEDSE